MGRDLFRDIANWLIPYEIKIENILVVIALSGFILKLLIPEIPAVFTLGMTLLSVFYFIMGLRNFDHQDLNMSDKWREFITNLYYWALVIAITGIQFKLSAWKGADTMIHIGVTCLTLVLTLYIYLLFKKRESIFLNKRFKLRLFIIVALCLFLRFSTGQQLEKWHLAPPMPEMPENIKDL